MRMSCLTNSLTQVSTLNAAFIPENSHHIMMIFTQNHLIFHSDSPSRYTALSAVALQFADAAQGTSRDLSQGWASCHHWPVDGDQDQVGARHPHHKVEAGHKPRGGVEEW